MKRYLGWLVLAVAVLWLGSWLWQRNWSPTAHAAAAAQVVLDAASRGDEATLAPLLAADSTVTPAGLIGLYRGKTPQVFDCVPALHPNQSGVEKIAIASWMAPDGKPRTTFVALRRDHGRWLVMLEGPSLSF